MSRILSCFPESSLRADIYNSRFANPCKPQKVQIFESDPIRIEERVHRLAFQPHHNMSTFRGTVILVAWRLSGSMEPNEKYICKFVQLLLRDIRTATLAPYIGHSIAEQIRNEPDFSPVLTQPEQDIADYFVYGVVPDGEKPF